MEIGTIRRLVRRWAWLVALFAVIAAGTAAAISFELPKVYTAQAVALVNPKQATLSSGAADSFSFNSLGVDGLIATYTRLINGGPIQQKLAAQGLPTTSVITAVPEKGTSLIDININDGDPQVAYEVAQRVIPAFNSALDELQARAAGTNRSVSKLDALVAWQLPTHAPTAPVSPKPTQNILLGLVAGAILGAALAGVLEFFDKSVKSEGDVRLRLDLPLLGPVVYRGRRFTRSNRGDVALVTITHPGDVVSEAYRAIRTNLLFNAIDRKLKTIVVTSAVPAEGKTSSACNLAVVMAQAGNRVILVDADFRRPQLHRVFGRPANRGLGNLILGDAPDEELILPTRVANLRVVCSGAHPPNPSELLGSARMEALTQRLKEMADVVIFDTPPVGAVTDATVLGSRSDGVILVVERGRADVQAVLRAKERLQTVGANILGVVLNKVPHAEVSQYYYEYDNTPAPKSRPDAGQEARPRTAAPAAPAPTGGNGTGNGRSGVAAPVLGSPAFKAVGERPADPATATPAAPAAVMAPASPPVRTEAPATSPVPAAPPAPAAPQQLGASAPAQLPLVPPAPPAADPTPLVLPPPSLPDDAHPAGPPTADPPRAPVQDRGWRD